MDGEPNTNTATVELTPDEQKVVEFARELPDAEREDFIALAGLALDEGLSADEAIARATEEPEADNEGDPAPDKLSRKRSEPKRRARLDKRQRALKLRMDLGALDWEYDEKRRELTVKDVPVMGLLSPSERSDFGMTGAGVDPKWFRRAIETYRLGVEKGKYPRLLRRHNGDGDMPAEVIGRLEDLYEDGFWLKARRVVVTNPDAIGKLSRGEFPSLSAEFYFDSGHLWGLSLIDGDNGHFDEELPDLKLKDGPELVELRKLSESGKPRAVRLAETPRLRLRDVGATLKLMGYGGTDDMAPMSLVVELMKRLALLEEREMTRDEADRNQQPPELDGDMDEDDPAAATEDPDKATAEGGPPTGEDPEKKATKPGDEPKDKPMDKKEREEFDQLKRRVEEQDEAAELDRLTTQVLSSARHLKADDVRAKLKGKPRALRAELATILGQSPKAPTDTLPTESEAKSFDAEADEKFDRMVASKAAKDTPEARKRFRETYKLATRRRVASA